ncbi:hypothetical protein B0H14DRAFT_3113120 [Mycena olivaceomarginata]|nr:hypothetical protein B0H14DRAFT_3113120 [Mycena olivaceomarginata]
MKTPSKLTRAMTTAFSWVFSLKLAISSRSCDSEDPGFGDVVSKANEAINEAVWLAYGSLEFDFLHSFAHSDEFPVLMGPHKDENVFSHRMSGLLDLMKQWMGTGRVKQAEDSGMLLRFTNSWKSTLRPHPLSTLLSRFEGDTARAPQGRFLGTAHRIDDRRPCMVSRTPILNYYFLDEDTSHDAFPLIARQSEVGLTDIAFTSAIDESNKLIFSYAWGDKESGEIYEDALPTHTLQTDNHHGPLNGSIGVWDLNTLKTHGPDWDETHRTQQSLQYYFARRASPGTGGMAYAPSAPSVMLCGTDTTKSNDYSCVSVDLEHGGRTVSRSEDPNVFLTAASDGHARLYDHRVTLPVLTLRGGTGDSDCPGGVLVHPDVVFTGAAHDQVIRLWDVRAQKMVYELSTGNNAVIGMTWDAPQIGATFDYRRAKVPRTPSRFEAMLGVEVDEDAPGSEDEDDYDDYDDDGPCWPKNAAYAEDYFGHLFDAGEHRILRYAFKDQPDPSILPPYGDASLDREPSW